MVNGGDGYSKFEIAKGECPRHPPWKRKVYDGYFLSLQMLARFSKYWMKLSAPTARNPIA